MKSEPKIAPTRTLLFAFAFLAAVSLFVAARADRSGGKGPLPTTLGEAQADSSRDPRGGVEWPRDFLVPHPSGASALDCYRVWVCAETAAPAPAPAPTRPAPSELEVGLH